MSSTTSLATKTKGADGDLLQSAVALRDQLQCGELSARDLAERYIARIEARESDVRAWAWFDAEFVRTEALRLDALKASGAPLGPLHGLPVGLKDVIDTKDMPSENGCRLDIGRRPEHDAALVKRLRTAGAIIMGKTVTTELAYFVPGATRNPHNLEHTPGGSSSGSAAAVADGMVPLAIGTQTGGSVIRPGSFCGIVGYKPTFGAIPRSGVLNQSQTLDTMGVFAADAEGALMLAEVLFGPDAGDAASLSSPVSDNVAADLIGASPRFAYIEPPFWGDVDADYAEALRRFAGKLGAAVQFVDLPDVFQTAEKNRRAVNFAEMASSFQRYLDIDPAGLGHMTRDAMEEGRLVSAFDYLSSVACRLELNDALAPIFAEFDAILCPAALGPAPRGLASTGNSIMNGLWTMAGTPAITLPLLTSPQGLPLGVQLVGKFGRDAQLLKAARWVYDRAALQE